MVTPESIQTHIAQGIPCTFLQVEGDGHHFNAVIVSEKFDQLAAFQNFLITPLTFLSGVFYSIHSLPPFWQALSHANPFFYMIDGFRYGFFGLSDAPPALSLAIVSACAIVLSLATLLLLRRGWKLRL